MEINVYRSPDSTLAAIANNCGSSAVRLMAAEYNYEQVLES